MEAPFCPSQRIQDFHLHAFRTQSSKHFGDRLFRRIKSLKKFADRYIKLDEIPFDFVRRRMSVILCRNDLRRILVCKGAVEEVLEICAQIGDENSQRPFTEPERKHLKALRDKLNAEGMRVVAVAWRPVGVTERDFSTHDEKDLILAGFIAFLDPPKASAGSAIKALQ